MNKIVSVLVTVSFLWSGISWTMPQGAPDISSLRARSAFERNSLAQSHMKMAGTNVSVQDPARSPAPEARAVSRIFDAVAGPIIMSDVRNARGELVVPGLITMVDQVLEWQGQTRPEGQKNFLSANRAGHIARRLLAQNPYIGARKDVQYVVYNEGRPATYRRTEYYNKVYEKVIRGERLDLTDDEIKYCLDNMQDNQVGRYCLLYIRAMSERGVAGYPQLWDRVVEIASFHAAFGVKNAAWGEISRGIIIDAGTALPIGNPERLPFGDPEAIDYNQLMKNIWTRTTVGVFSVSGIRQIFDPTFGDQPLARFPCRYAIGTEPTLAAKCHAAAQAALFAEVLKGSAAFADKIPRLAGQTEQQRGKLKEDFVKLLNETQQGKAKRDKPRIAILLDTRSTGPALADVDIRALLAQGIEVEYGFVSSVCEAAIYTKTNPNIDGCIYISASHNDEGYNGIKLLLGDGRVMPEAVAYPYIFVLRGDAPRVKGPERVKGVLEDADYVKDLIRGVSGVSTEEVLAIYRGIPLVKERSQEADRNYRNRVVTGAKSDEEAQPLIAKVKARVSPLKLAIICDPNGGARDEAKYLEGIGIKVYTISQRPRYDMKHELCPSTVAVQETDEELAKMKERAQKEGYTVIGSFHYDTDGDRRNFRPIDQDKAFYLRPDMAQICFALDIIGYTLSEENYNFKNHRPKRLLGISVNCPTAMLIEDLAEVLGIIVIRTQTGEAYVADGMNRLSGMTWAQAKEMAQKGEQEIIVPKRLYRWFDGTHDSDAINVIAGGEGSNGSDFTKELLVRDPLHTIRSLVHFLNPETGRKAVRTLLARMGKEEEFAAQWADLWDNPGKMSTIMYRLIEALPVNKTTDFFSIGGEGEKVNPPLIMGLVKDNFDDIFENEFKERVIERLAKIWGVDKSAIKCAYVNTEEIAKVGRGNRSKTAAVGRQIGDGGYKVKFTIEKDGKPTPLGWIWFRDSITETSLTRRGVSVVISASIQDLDRQTQIGMADEAYKFLNDTLTQAMDRAVAVTSEQILTYQSVGPINPKLAPYASQLAAARSELESHVKKSGETGLGQVGGAVKAGKALLAAI